jgi:D-psicose/D-tagatose/L-ribulose 3-epimerase
MQLNDIRIDSPQVQAVGSKRRTGGVVFGADNSKLKLGAHIYLWTERWADSEVGLCAHAHTLGLDALELSLGLDVTFSSALTRQAAEDAGIDLLVGPGGTWPDGADLSDDDPVNRQIALDFHRGIIDQAAEIGAVAYAGALYGRPGKVLRRRPPADEMPRAAEGLAQLAAHAEFRGISLAIEPMSRFRSHLCNTPAQALQLLALAGSPANLHVLLDTYHLITEVRDYAAAIRSVDRNLWGLHASENDRGVPGSGLVPWQHVFSALRETPCVYVGLESYNTGANVGDFSWRRGMFQELCPDGDAFVRAGVAFLRGQLMSGTEDISGARIAAANSLPPS